MPGGFNFGGSSSSDDSTLDADLTISGVNAYAYIDGVANETITIKDGTYFDEDSTIEKGPSTIARATRCG